MAKIELEPIGTVRSPRDEVRDDAARTLMTEFYENLWQKKLSKAEALRQAQQR